MSRITLPDESVIEVESGKSVIDAAAQIGKKLAKAAIAGRINGDTVDVSAPLPDEGSLEILTDRDDESLEILRHSAAHVMAAAVKKIFKDVKFGIGPAIDTGFYYDFDIGRPLTEEDLPAIEKEMKRIIKADEKFIRIDIAKKEALARMKEAGETYKTELIEELEDGTLSLYETGEFTDLCRGPHIPSTRFIKAFKLLSIAGAYWRGKSENPMLQRIYGTAFFSQEELDTYLKNIEEAKKRDHRKIGAELDLFSFHEEAAGFPFWHPNGVIIYNEVVDFWKEIHRKHGYSEIKTPLILNDSLWHLSGHWDNYKENMYFTDIDENTHAVKPMNCPGGLLIFGSKLHSYKDFPLRVAELGTVHRHELSGVLHGLFRVRAFTQDDAHIFCTPDQIEEEIVGVIKLMFELYGSFGLKDYHIELSTRPEKSIGSDEIWEVSEKALENALNSMGTPFELNPGDGAFYGPKIDFHIKDSMGRSWQCGTVQLDFSMPKRFADEGYNVKYVDSDNEYKTPVMIHRAVLGSLERFIGIIIEEYAGKLPLWLSPVQVLIINITSDQEDYARKIRDRLAEAGLRAELDLRNEKLGYKVREAIVRKIPYVFVVGDKEMADNAVSVRHMELKDLGVLKTDDIIDKLVEENRARSTRSVFT